LTLKVDGKVICDSKATYGTITNKNGTKAGGAMGGMAAMGRMVESVSRLAELENYPKQELVARHEPGGMKQVEHITKMSLCFGDNIGVHQVKKGQKWTITGHYDYDQHAGMAENGKQSNVMGIAIMMVKNWTA